MPARILIVLVAAAAIAAGAYVSTLFWPDALKSAQGWFAQVTAVPQPTAAKAPAAPPPPKASIIVVQPAETQLPIEYAGRVDGFRNVEVRPRVGGLLLKREYVEGAIVKQGEVLFRIDPATYEVALARAEAQRQQVLATLKQTEENFKRIAQLSKKEIATERQHDDALAQRDAARANVQLADAEIRTARLNLEYTTVVAPQTGVTALQSPPEGTLIQAQQTLLTTITQLDPAYVNFSFTDTEAQTYREMNEKRASPIAAESLTVELHYSNGAVYPHKGRIDMAAQRVDVQTGTIEARAIFPNPDGAILPGQFVRIAVEGVSLSDAIVVPAKAISQGPQGPSVFVVGEKDVAEARPVRLGQEVSGGWIVQEGLKAGERVVVDGVMRVRPGLPVRPVPVDSASPSDQAAAATPQNGKEARP